MEKLNLLIVDDERGIREGGRRVLRSFSVRLPYLGEDYGFDIETAETGEEAVEMFKERRHHIVLLDNQLPGMNGTEVLTHLSELDPDVHTIMITAYASLETAVAATKNGAYDFLTKPFTPEELKSAVHKAAKHIILTTLTRKLTEEKHKVRFEFLRVLAHELKSPINAVSGYLQLMENHSGGEEISKYDHIVRRSIQRMEGMKKLINDLLDLTRIESGEKKRELTSLNVTSLAREIMDDNLIQASPRGIALRLNSPEDVVMKADSTEMTIILSNLISNAVKYNRENGFVDVILEKIDKKVIITVSDTGIGIGKEDLKKLFGEFVRLKNEKTRDIPGSGLGLSILKKLAIAYNGKVKVDSEVDKGTTFTVELQSSP